jgi:hypothetical protein
MFNRFLISKKLLGKFKVKQKNPLALSCKKVTETPRAYSTAQIKSATENILFVDTEENILPEITIKSIEYLLKDLFIQMHQTGLYNRQFKLWKSLANIIEISVLKLQKGLLKKNELNAYVIDFFIDPTSPCISAVIDENENTSEFQVYLERVIGYSNLNRLKGVFYFLNCIPNEHFVTKLKFDTSAFDSISKYESILIKANDVRLNVISYHKDNDKYVFKHVYPELKSIKSEESMILQ